MPLYAHAQGRGTVRQHCQIGSLASFDVSPRLWQRIRKDNYHGRGRRCHYSTTRSVQLAQVKVPLTTAADAFVRRDAGPHTHHTHPQQTKNIRENTVFAAIGILIVAAAAQYVLGWWIVPWRLP